MPSRSISTLLLAYGFAALGHGTDEALRVVRDAHHSAEIHERLVEIEHIACRNERLRDRPQMTLHRVALRIARADEDAKEDTGDVCVEDGRALAKGEAPYGACRVGADAFEGEQRLLVGREAAVVACDCFARNRVQPAGPDVV